MRQRSSSASDTRGPLLDAPVQISVSLAFAVAAFLGASPALASSPASPFSGCPPRTAGGGVVIVPASSSIRTPAGAVEPGDSIALYSASGQCIGSGTMGDGPLAIVVWADDPLTPVADGFVEGEVPELRVFDASEETTHVSGVTASYEPGRTLADGLATGGVYVVEAASEVSVPTSSEDGPGQVVVGNPFPNPATGAATVQVQSGGLEAISAEVYDMVGRRVAVADVRSTSDGADIHVDARPLAAGLYVVMVRVGEAVSSRRFVVTR